MSNDPLVIVPVPSLIAVLLNAEEKKGKDLTQDEVNEITEHCTCMTMPFSVAYEMELKRGYRDIRPEYAWQDWLEYKNNPECLSL